MTFPEVVFFGSTWYNKRRKVKESQNQKIFDRFERQMVRKMKSSDLIAAFLLGELEKQDGALELQRNELAQQFNVVPSQINYVIASRFTPERGYIIESRRGGGGYIRIRRVRQSRGAHIMHIVNAVGKSINAFNAELFLQNMLDYGYITPAAARLMASAVSENALSSLSPAVRDYVRADILKNMLITLVTE